MPIPFKKDPMEFKQRALFATNVFDLLPSDHPCYVYEDIFEQLDTSSVEEKFSVRGHPSSLLSVQIVNPPYGLRITDFSQIPLGRLGIRNHLLGCFRILAQPAFLPRLRQFGSNALIKAYNVEVSV